MRINVCGPGGSTPGSMAIFGIWRDVGLPSRWDAYLPGAQVFLADLDRPYWKHASAEENRLAEHNWSFERCADGWTAHWADAGCSDLSIKPHGNRHFSIRRRAGEGYGGWALADSRVLPATAGKRYAASFFARPEASSSPGYARAELFFFNDNNQETGRHLGGWVRESAAWDWAKTPTAEAAAPAGTTKVILRMAWSGVQDWQWHNADGAVLEERCDGGCAARWTNSAVRHITLVAQDDGLGVKQTRVNHPRLNAPEAVEQKLHPCDGGRLAPCPASHNRENNGYGNVFTYNTDEMPEGINRIGVLTGDITDNTPSGDGSPTTGTVPAAKVDRTAPAFDTPVGALYDRRNRSDDKRFQGLYDRYHSVDVTARDGSTASNSTERSGVRTIAFQLVNPAGTVVQSSTDPSPQSCSTSCPKARVWTLDGDSVADGVYTVRAIARDQVGFSSTRSWEVTVDRRGDIYRADDFAESSTSRVATDWGKLSQRRARRVTTTYIRTRFDAEERARTRGTDYDSTDEDGYWVRRSDRSDDPNLDPVAGFVETRDTANGSGWATVETGDLNTVLQIWQVPPPAHGTTFQRRQRTANGRIMDIWQDAQTKAPIKRTSRDSNGTLLGTRYWSYAVDRRTDGEVPADLFQVPKPAKTGIEEEEEFSSGGARTNNVTDEETRTTFAGRSLGSTAALDAGLVCFARALKHRQRLSGESAAGYDDPELDDNERGYPGRSAPSTGVDAYYVAQPNDGTCAEATAGKLGTPPLMVWTMGARSSEAQAWQGVYEREGTYVGLSPTDDDFAFGGVVPVIIDASPTNAYSIRDDAGPWSSFLVRTGDVVVIVRGPLTKEEIPLLAANLKVM